MVTVKEAKIIKVAKVTEIYTMRLCWYTSGNLSTNPEKEARKDAQSPETLKTVKKEISGDN
jgi:hypothetical protein